MLDILKVNPNSNCEILVSGTTTLITVHAQDKSEAKTYKKVSLNQALNFIQNRIARFGAYENKIRTHSTICKMLKNARKALASQEAHKEHQDWGLTSQCEVVRLVF